jgi:hypothetical protein
MIQGLFLAPVDFRLSVGSRRQTVRVVARAVHPEASMAGVGTASEGIEIRMCPVRKER